MTGYACSGVRISIVAASMAMLLASPARAQQVASTFEELRGLIKPGETIYITDANGATSKGRFGSLSAGSLQLLHREPSAPPVRLSEGDVNNIAVERADSLRNGMLIGFASCAVPVALIGAAVPASAGEVAGVAAGYGVIGLLTGLLIDVVNKEKVTIYVHGPRPRSTHIRVSPIVVNAGAGVRVSAEF